MMFLLTLLVVFLYWTDESGGQIKNYEIVFEGMFAEDDFTMKRYISEVKGKIQRISHQEKVIDGFAVIDEQMPDDAIVEIAGYEKNGNVYSEAPFFKHRKNVCEFLDNDQMFMPPIRRASNFEKCPLVPNNYTITRYRAQEELLPPVLPGSDRWKLCARLFHENVKFQGMCLLLYIDRSKSIISKKRFGFM